MTVVPIRLLLLEDNPGDARLVQAALADQAPGEFAVTTVKRLADALARIGAEPFDAMLSDLSLPDSTGLGTAQAIVAGAPALPLVVLTGSHSEDLGRAAIKLGAQDYLVKGETRAPTVARTLRYAIERKRLEIELRLAKEVLEQRVAERTADLEAAMKELRASEDLYRDLVENSQDLICTHDLEGKLLSVNAAAVRLTGYPQEALLRMNMADLLTRGARDGFAGYLNEIRTKGAARGLLHIQTAGGETRWWQYNNTLRTKDLAASVVRGLAQDITERKKAADALRESEQKYRGIYENLQDVYIEADLEGTILEVSPQIEILSRGQYARDDVLGKSTDMFHAEPARRDAFYLALREHGTVKDFEAAFTNRDGSPVVCSISAKIQLDANGKPGRVCATVRDMTERKLGEEQLRAAEERFRGLAEQSIAGIYVIQDDRLVYVNPRFAEIFGYGSAEELVGGDPLSVVAEQEREANAEHMRRRIAGDVASTSYQFTGLRKDGSTIEVGVHGARATHGGRPAIIGMMQDISEKKRADEQIQRYIQQLKSAVVSTVRVATTLSEMRDPYTAGHERRVAEIAAAIGAELGFDDPRIEGLRVAGHLHDVGKITIPAEILSKPGKLSPIELQLIQAHPQASYDVLKGVEFSWPVAEIALQHHERMDGSGYPQGLKGNAILLDARIIAVADVVEAMSSHRPYRPGLGIDKALAEIERGRGSAYDPVVADACLKLFGEQGYAIPA